MIKQSAKDAMVLPQLPLKEQMLNNANRILELLNGAKLSDHDTRMGFKKPYIINLLATQLMVMSQQHLREKAENE